MNALSQILNAFFRLKGGDGHSGFAIALAADAPFGVIRTLEKEEKKEETDKKLKKALEGHIVDGGLLVITGHHSLGEKEIIGNYDEPDGSPSPQTDSAKDFQMQIRRGPDQIVQTAMATGLPRGSHLTVLLCICYGARNATKPDGEEVNTSFAYRLASEFAKEGISTSIIASNQWVGRFGAGALDQANGSLTFSASVGMVPNTIRVFNSTIENQTMHMQVETPSNQTIRFDKEGMHLSSVGASVTEHEDSSVHVHLPPSSTDSQVRASSVPATMFNRSARASASPQDEMLQKLNAWLAAKYPDAGASARARSSKSWLTP